MIRFEAGGFELRAQGGFVGVQLKAADDKMFRFLGDLQAGSALAHGWSEVGPCCAFGFGVVVVREAFVEELVYSGF